MKHEEGAYKQTEETPCYQGRDVAVMRGKLCGATVVLRKRHPSARS